MDIKEIKRLKFGSEVVWHSYKKDEQEKNIKRILRIDLDDTSYPNQRANFSYNLNGVGNNHPHGYTPSRYKGSITLWDGYYANKMDIEEFKKYYRILKI